MIVTGELQVRRSLSAIVFLSLPTRWKCQTIVWFTGMDAELGLSVRVEGEDRCPCVL